MAVFKLPYRLIFSVATLNSVYIYDTESNEPIAILAGVHYAAITDISWSPTGKHLALSSQDGYCTLLEFKNQELGSLISSSEEDKVLGGESGVSMMDESVSCREAKPSQDTAAAKNGKSEQEINQEKRGIAIASTTPVSNKPAKRRIIPMAID